MQMIAEHNRRQLRLAALHFAMTTLALLGAGLFFYLGSTFVIARFGLDVPEYVPLAITVFCIGVIFVTGIVEFSHGKGHNAYQESDLFLWQDASTPSGYCSNRTVADIYSPRLTVPAHLLTQTFLAAPLQLMQGITRIRSRIPYSPVLESELGSLLSRINGNDQWHSAEVYSNQGSHLAYLIRMEKVQFSPSKGSIRPL